MVRRAFPTAIAAAVALAAALALVGAIGGDAALPGTGSRGPSRPRTYLNELKRIKAEFQNRTRSGERRPSPPAAGRALAQGSGGAAPPAIIGGNTVDPSSDKYPFFAMLFTVSDIQLEDDQSPPVKIFTCGATLIAPRLALTAAHCVDFWEADDVSAAYVQTGRWNRSKTVEEEGGYEYKVVRYEMHPDYVPYVYHNDVAVLYLSDPLVTGTGSPAVIRVNFAEADPAPGSVTKAVGFGEANTDFFLDGDNIRGAPRYLQEVNLTAASNEDCISALNNYTLENWGDPYTEEDFDPSFLCAGDPGKDTCQGDSGGPLMQFMDDGSFAQVGITSWGFGCAETFGVYSRISSFRPWLEYFSHRDHPNDDITHHRDSLVDKDMGHCHADLGAPHALLPPCPERSQLLQHAADLPLGAAGHCFLWRRGRGAPLRCPPLVVGGLHVDQRPVHEHRFPARDARQRDQMRGSHSRCTHDL